ncbi:MAG: 4-hydroxythreonine-4-phosphate dehydrogenase PdxA [Aestuariivita sp.]|nr:4-hydroxythreonine-4-phosphate dehydrogenase PdxA [Aestuariivita sp.]MCY4203873.1 4-hydroxythreonine-4-phosphate dehydrogenase PdxA [Aestuariivita sp.]MCY4287853.1 4-hydroxythreonine-4-phosphate dehydrogenase PdxA [Aestuariivita sp.]MCY4345306.1 4-hydroxythreonine-4-phosphate dehydrogenase PdxA [Aestuariivita sp.]
MTSAPIVLTCGDPAGIGPELIGETWRTLCDEIVFYVIGDAAHIPRNHPIVRIDKPEQANNAMSCGIPVLHYDFSCASRPGTPDPRNAPDIVSVINRAVDDVTSGRACAMTTMPIAKSILIAGANFCHTGHTDYLADKTNASNVAMMLVGPDLRVVPTTIHIPLSQVPEHLTPQKLQATLEVTIHGLREYFGIKEPRLVVSGLNPHAGEDGKLGTEEVEWINAVIKNFCDTSTTVTGPHSADSLFHTRARQTYDAAIMMYHDQALIPVKTLYFDCAVNLTLGLPFVRTSPDHGTAFDIAGQGKASAASAIAAIRLAKQLVDRT